MGPITLPRMNRQARPESEAVRLARLDHAHLWHPFTPMRQWRGQTPMIIERGEGPYLIDTEGRRYIDGSSSLWCNLHGHRVEEIDRAVRDQLDRIAHTTLLGLSSPPAIELAAMLADRAPGRLNKVFYSDAGATALELAFKMAVGYWHHRGRPGKHRFIGLEGAYHGDTTGAMSVGFAELFHKPFVSMVFDVTTLPNPDPIRLSPGKPPDANPRASASHSGTWPSEDPAHADALKTHCLTQLEKHLRRDADHTAAVVLEPRMQGAAGMIPQPPGFLKEVEQLARRHDVLLIADEVATGFGRTGRLFACEHENVQPDLLCLAKGLSAGYLPLAATLATDEIEQAFTGDGATNRGRTLYHGHTYTGNPLACAAAVASLRRFEQRDLLTHIQQSATLMDGKLRVLADPQVAPHVLDVRRRGIMAGIEIAKDRATAEPFDPAARTAAAICHQMRPKGLIVRPIGDVIMLMPIPAMEHEVLERMLDIVVETLSEWRTDSPAYP